MAKVQCLKAIDAVPNKWQAYNNLGVAYHNLGLYEQALVAYGKAMKLYPGGYSKRVTKNISITEEALEHIAPYVRKNVMLSNAQA